MRYDGRRNPQIREHSGGCFPGVGAGFRYSLAEISLRYHSHNKAFVSQTTNFSVSMVCHYSSNNYNDTEVHRRGASEVR